jgi:2-polyprenyl-6-hydroxyphenyl methylase/3-demethylubiquinone-9 3-methyltransferase
MITRKRARNDPAQYDELAEEWWEPSGEFAALHWLAASRARHVPPAPHADAVLVDLACGGGLMGPHVARLGYRHVGVDIGLRGLELAREHGVTPVRGSVLAVPLADGCADVVLAGEILEHVEDHEGVLTECARLLRSGGTLVLDALAAGRLSTLINVHLLERLPVGRREGCTIRRCSSTGGGCWPPPTGWAWTSSWWGSGRRCGRRSPGGSAGATWSA